MESEPFRPPSVRYPRRAGAWRLRTRTLAFGESPALMGIVNVTPDSFSDGGRFYDAARAIDHGMRLAADGAELLDVGGESTRPYADVVPVDEELRRVIPVVEALAARSGAAVSIDTSKSAVAREAIAAGAEVVNDVTALAGDSAMLDLVLEAGVGVCAMHMRGTPQTMQDDPRYADVAKEVFDCLEERKLALLAAGLAPERLALDPGIGFGKTHQHSLTLLAECWRLHALGCPVLVGHSRKGFIGKVIRDKEADRTAGTIGVAISLALQGVQVLRIHDVAEVRQALALFAAAGGLDGQALHLADSTGD